MGHKNPTVKKSSTENTEAKTVEIRNLSKIYNSDTGGDVVAVDSIDLSVSAGEFVSIVGPSGCGKTTLLKCIGNIISPTEGEILVNGQDAKRARKEQQIAYFFQEDVLLPWRSVIDNVTLPLEMYGGNIDNTNVEQRAKEVLKTVGLEGFERNYPEELSGGMRQRVALARGFVYNPDVFLMDEPFAALDELTRRKMNTELLRIHREIEKTTVFVTHHLSEAIWLSDRVIILSPQPGEIDQVVSIDLDRPRDVDMRSSDKFVEIESRLMNRIMSFES
jgi:NitT/TauT family transport system ATP-binding protein